MHRSSSIGSSRQQTWEGRRKGKKQWEGRIGMLERGDQAQK
jgi:hypothetical protein